MKIPISLLLTLFQGMILVDGAISPSRDDASVLMDAPVSPNVASHGNATRIPPFGNFIIGGTAAAEGVFPYMAIMELTPGYVHCGGVMISPTWFLTASHCRCICMKEMNFSILFPPLLPQIPTLTN